MSQYEFPPNSKYDVQINQMANVYQTLLSKEKNAIYISTPMTSGWRYLENTNVSKDKRNLFFTQNCNHARSVAAITRLHYPTSIVIDPTNIHIPDWSQNDYLTFWRKVIVDYVYIIRFVDDWYYSNGCAYEFLIGVLTNKIIMDEQENPISARQGRELIQKACDKYESVNQDSTFLTNIIKSLDKFIYQEDGS